MFSNSGYVFLTNERKVIYSQDEFLFKFMIPQSGSFKETVKISPSNKFIYGKNHENHNIAIFMGKTSFNLYTYKNFHTSLYLVSKGNVYDHKISKFKSILFEGGVLYDLIDTNGYDLKGTDFAINLPKEKSIKINDLITLIYSYGCKTNKTGVETKPYIKLDFAEEVSIDCIHQYLSLVYELCSILTFRKNISFDSIDIDRYSIENHYICFIDGPKYDLEHLIRTLNIEEVFDNLPIILNMILENKKQTKHPLFSLNYLFESKKDSQYVSVNLIKDTCTALEIECCNYKELFTEEDIKIEQLKNKVKELIDNEKKGLNLESSSYSNIISSMQYWSMGIKDKFRILAEKYKDILVEYSKCKRLDILDYENNISLEKISKFVNFRNKNTHPGVAELTTEIADITFMMQVLAYASLLSRFGISEELIKRKIVFLV